VEQLSLQDKVLFAGKLPAERIQKMSPLAKRLGVSCVTWMMREIWGRMPEEFGWGGRHLSEKHR
jgi:hypothetical protein